MKKVALFISSVLLPTVALAQQTGYITNWVTAISGWLSTAVVAVMVLLTIGFLYNVFRYVSEKDPKNLPDRRKAVLHGLLGVFIAACVWGIVQLAARVFGVQQGAQVNSVCPPGMVYTNGQCR